MKDYGKEPAMTVTDEAKLFAIRQQLIQSQRNLYAAIKIINYVFERDDTPTKLDNDSVLGYDTCISDPVTGLYPGQKSLLPDYTDVDPDEPESYEEVIECVE